MGKPHHLVKKKKMDPAWLGGKFCDGLDYLSIDAPLSKKLRLPESISVAQSHEL